MTAGTEPALLIMTDLKMIIRHLRLVEYARELGLTPVMVFSRPDTEPLLRELMADPAHPLSGLGELCLVADPSVTSVLAGVRDVVERYDVRGALSCGEYFVEAAGALTELLGLPGTGWPAAMVSRNKLMQRYLLADWAPRWRVVRPAGRSRAAELDPDMGWPRVVKPISRMSSSGVRRVRAPGELAEVLAGYPETEVLLVEECLLGAEYSVESLVRRGDPLWQGITRKETNEDRGVHFVETAHTVPADDLDPDQIARVTETNAAVLRRLGVRDAITHAEYRLTEGGVMLMEVALRLPGDGITVLWSLATGSSMEERIVDVALDRPVRYPQPRRRVRHGFLSHPHGTLADVRGDRVCWTTRDLRWPRPEPASADAPPRTCAVLVSKLAGDTLGPIVDSDARAVSVIIDAPLAEHIDELAKRAATGVEIVVS
jgi:biotin carboxylase